VSGVHDVPFVVTALAGPWGPLPTATQELPEHEIEEIPVIGEGDGAIFQVSPPSELTATAVAWLLATAPTA
jgi:hypothetical protein